MTITNILEEKIYREICWILQEIKEQQYFSLNKEKIIFRIRKNNTDNIPSPERQKELLIKLKKDKVIKGIEANELTEKIIFYHEDKKYNNIENLLDNLTSFILTIDQKKLDKSYLKCKTHKHYLLLNTEVTANQNICIIQMQTLNYIAEQINGIKKLEKSRELGYFLKTCGVERDFYLPILITPPFKIDASKVYSKENIRQAFTNPTPPPAEDDFENFSREKVLYRIILYYSCTENQNKIILFKIIENLVNPSLFDGDDKKTKEFERVLNNCLIIDGYILKNGKLIEKTNTYIKRQTTVNATEKDWLIHGKLKFNEITGDFQLGKVKGNFPPDTQEYTLLLTLLKSEYRQSDYITLLKAIMPEKNIKRENIKSKKIQLSIVIRNIKNKMKILPRKKFNNKDIFKVMKVFGGYRLIE